MKSRTLRGKGSNLWQGKSRPFSSLLGPSPRESSGSIDGHNGANKGGEAEANCVTDKVFFEQFKHTGEDTGDCGGSCSVGEVESCNIDEAQESRKRKNPFQGLSSYLTAIFSYVSIWYRLLQCVGDFKSLVGFINRKFNVLLGSAFADLWKRKLKICIT